MKTRATFVRDLGLLGVGGGLVAAGAVPVGASPLLRRPLITTALPAPFSVKDPNSNGYSYYSYSQRPGSQVYSLHISQTDANGNNLREVARLDVDCTLQKMGLYPAGNAAMLFPWDSPPPLNGMTAWGLTTSVAAGAASGTVTPPSQSPIAVSRADYGYDSVGDQILTSHYGASWYRQLWSQSAGGTCYKNIACPQGQLNKNLWVGIGFFLLGIATVIVGILASGILAFAAGIVGLALAIIGLFDYLSDRVQPPTFWFQATP